MEEMDIRVVQAVQMEMEDKLEHLIGVKVAVVLDGILMVRLRDVLVILIKALVSLGMIL